MLQHTKPPPPSNNGWTPERRRKQAEKIKNWKPWEKSTGPTTQIGKNTCRFNALKSGSHSVVFKDCAALLNMNKQMLKEYDRLFMKMAVLNSILKRKKRTNGI